MDEIDAALGTFYHIIELFTPLQTLNLYDFYGIPDFKNVSIVGHYVKDRTKNAQFIIIRHVSFLLSFLKLFCYYLTS